MKKIIIVLLCILSGCILCGINFYFDWVQFNLTVKNQISFVSWLILSNDGMEHLLDAFYDLGIGLIGSAFFLIMVDWTLINVEKRVVDATELESKRREIAWEMRNSPQLALEIYRASGNHLKIFTDQFFQGCIWIGLKLDGLDFSKSDFTNADLSNSSLVGANLTDCILSGAVLKNAKLTCVNFMGSNVSDEQLKEAYSLWNSTMPNGEKYDGRFMLSGDVKEARQYGYDIVNDEKARNDYFSKVDLDE